MEKEIRISEQLHKELSEVAKQKQISLGEALEMKLNTESKPAKQSVHVASLGVDVEKYNQIEKQYQALQQEKEQLEIQLQGLNQSVAEQEAKDITFENISSEDNDLKDLFTTDDLEMKTDLTPNQIQAFAKAKTVADNYNVPILKKFLTNYASYAVSKNRKGRQEYVESFKTKILEPLGMGGLSNNENGKNDGK